MGIWYKHITCEELNALNKGTLGEFFGIRFVEVGPEWLKATMTVEDRHRQPFGLLHGGASVALAETVGSVASLYAVNPELFMGVGVEINANHLKMVTEGQVVATCKPLKVGGKMHVWDIKIEDQSGELSCVCRFTCMIVPKKNLSAR